VAEKTIHQPQRTAEARFIAFRYQSCLGKGLEESMRFRQYIRYQCEVDQNSLRRDQLIFRLQNTATLTGVGSFQPPLPPVCQYPKHQILS
jgi:hypothetical protein